MTAFRGTTCNHALGFYAPVGGIGKNASQELNVKPGINTSLPDATFKNGEPQDKLSLYEQVRRDSGNIKNQFENLPQSGGLSPGYQE